ncbi:probable palmitoyltransferase ZDHHC1 [Pelobates cultripes]|uniref:Palmitoyltransferase n=1 Tax=Pelobates cultripes TaxID=61616 RepID=A0AAD1THH4_PELCU|nr:probable palmitoyltransferase ZDHHC1 [Pelobates cultripes]
MTNCKKQSSKTVVPAKEVGDVSAEPPQHSRKNGWSWPPHPLQFVAWVTYLFFAVVGFGILVPLLPPHWLAAGYICMGALFALHLVVHFLAVTINPADDNVRAKGSPGPLPVFDRNKHAHVIENMHCYICEVDVGPKSKHCSLCNKCVSNFDHHCKWLNNCVGGKNYWLFFNCLISGFLGTFILTIISSYVFAAYFIDPALLRTNEHFEVSKNLTSVWYAFLPSAPVETQAAAILALAALISLMGFVTILLLGQLLCFHIYLLWEKLSTYEYIMHQRQKQEMKSGSRNPEEGDSPPAGQAQIEEEVYGGSLIYTNPDVRIKGSLNESLGKSCPTLSIDNEKLDGELQSDPGPSLSVPKKPRTKKKKKRKKSNQVSPRATESHSDGGPPQHVFPLPPRTNNESPISPTPPGRAVQSPAYQSQSLPVFASINNRPIQASGPPAEYHSDSAESMEEIPVAQTHLGSSSMSENVFLSQSMPKDLLNGSEHGLKQSYLRPVIRQQKFELLSKVPSVFVSETSGQPLPNGHLMEARVTDNLPNKQHKNMRVTRGKVGEQALSFSNTNGTSNSTASPRS